jgi:hypothetical protein
MAEAARDTRLGDELEVSRWKKASELRYNQLSDSSMTEFSNANFRNVLTDWRSRGWLYSASRGIWKIKHLPE